MDDTLRLEILELIEELVSESEKQVYANDDPSGLYTEWLIDSERLRAELQARITKLKNQD